jgi:hypothetical protein
VARIRVSTIIDVPPKKVWADIRDLSSHVAWMEDAESIRFTSYQRTGVGTTLECATRVGPFRLNDVMEVVEWEEGRGMTVRHSGVVTGTGKFVIRRRLRGGTRFTWEERLSFPWWMGGPVGAVVGGQVLRVVWRRNLSNLKARLEG